MPSTTGTSDDVKGQFVMRLLQNNHNGYYHDAGRPLDLLLQSPRSSFTGVTRVICCMQNTTRQLIRGHRFLAPGEVVSMWVDLRMPRSRAASADLFQVHPAAWCTDHDCGIQFDWMTVNRPTDVSSDRSTE